MSLINNFANSQRLIKRLHEIVPGGGHTYSKGIDQFPYKSPQIIAKAKGAYCTDVDGNRFLDWAMGNRVFILGHGNEVVNNAVKKAVDDGVNYTRPGLLELELAEYLLDLHPWAEMVKFGKNGSDVTTAAIKLARAATGREIVAVCGDHPFFSTHDWFIGSTAMDAGTLDNEKRTTVKFKYNDLESVEALFQAYPGQIAAVILEPVKNDEPKPGFLEGLRAIATREHAVLIFDEMIAGMRFHHLGGHHLYNVQPDLATFGKAVSNGYSFSFLIGCRSVMELGGLLHEKPRVFVLSQTHASETVGLAACMATMKECIRLDVASHVWRLGAELKNRVLKLAQEHGVAKYVRIIGFDCNPQILVTNGDGVYWPELHTAFHEEVIAHGVLIPWISITWEHRERELDLTDEALSAGMRKVRLLLDSGGDVASGFEGEPVKPVFRKYNRVDAP
jgi:glutamate-1-semialdehyde 2,1-aminomutase